MAVSFRVDYLRGWHRPHLLPMSLWTGKLSGWLSDTGRHRRSAGTGGGTSRNLIPAWPRRTWGANERKEDGSTIPGPSGKAEPRKTIRQLD